MTVKSEGIPAPDWGEARMRGVAWFSHSYAPHAGLRGRGGRFQ
jgi:hypothetical protein